MRATVNIHCNSIHSVYIHILVQFSNFFWRRKTIRVGMFVVSGPQSQLNTMRSPVTTALI